MRRRTGRMRCGAIRPDIARLITAARVLLRFEILLRMRIGAAAVVFVLDDVLAHFGTIILILRRRRPALGKALGAFPAGAVARLAVLRKLLVSRFLAGVVGHRTLSCSFVWVGRGRASPQARPTICCLPRDVLSPGDDARATD